MSRISTVKRLLFLTAFVALCASVAYAEVRVPKSFSDNAVLQQGVPVNVWGWADPGESVTVLYAGQSLATTADDQGKWKIQLAPMRGSFEERSLTIKGENTVRFKNVVVGEVWVCSGQSNMEMPMYGVVGRPCGTEEELNGDFSQIRYNKVTHWVANEPREDMDCVGWKECKEGAQKTCTACGFYFARRLVKELNVPVGLVDCNWSGSYIGSWIPDEGWNSDPELAAIHQEYLANLGGMGNRKKHSEMYNGMLAPWTNYTIHGALWYQGEANADEGAFYAIKQKALIRAWRQIWNQGDFPFYWVQLTAFAETSDDPAQVGNWPGLRDAQTLCLDIPHTGQAVIYDVGETMDPHPVDKYDVGNRLALWALAQEFGRDTVEPQSPTFSSLTIEGNQAIVKFEHVGAGLVVGKKSDRAAMKIDWNGELKRFALCGADGKWVWAKGKITSPDTVVLTADGVDAPVAARYAWQKNPQGANLYSAEGLPATPFRTDK